MERSAKLSCRSRLLFGLPYLIPDHLGARVIRSALLVFTIELHLPGQLHIVFEGFGVAERLLARGLLRGRAREDLLYGHL
jgi:hypothetical protein